VASAKGVHVGDQYENVRRIWINREQDPGKSGFLFVQLF
jgi:hypothetical protein